MNFKQGEEFFLGAEDRCVLQFPPKEIDHLYYTLTPNKVDFLTYIKPIYQSLA